MRPAARSTNEGWVQRRREDRGPCTGGLHEPRGASPASRADRDARRLAAASSTSGAARTWPARFRAGAAGCETARPATLGTDRSLGASRCRGDRAPPEPTRPEPTLPASAARASEARASSPAAFPAGRAWRGCSPSRRHASGTRRRRGEGPPRRGGVGACSVGTARAGRRGRRSAASGRWSAGPSAASVTRLPATLVFFRPAAASGTGAAFPTGTALVAAGGATESVFCDGSPLVAGVGFGTAGAVSGTSSLVTAMTAVESLGAAWAGETAVAAATSPSARGGVSREAWGATEARGCLSMSGVTSTTGSVSTSGSSSARTTGCPPERPRDLAGIAARSATARAAGSPSR